MVKSIHNVTAYTEGSGHKGQEDQRSGWKTRGEGPRNKAGSEQSHGIFPLIT